MESESADKQKVKQSPLEKLKDLSTDLETLVFNAGVKRMKVLEQNPNTKVILSDMQKKAEKSLKELREKQAKEREIVSVSRSGESEAEYMDNRNKLLEAFN